MAGKIWNIFLSGQWLLGHVVGDRIHNATYEKMIENSSRHKRENINDRTYSSLVESSLSKD